MTTLQPADGLLPRPRDIRLTDDATTDGQQSRAATVRLSGRLHATVTPDLAPAIRWWAEVTADCFDVTVTVDTDHQLGGAEPGDRPALVATVDASLPAGGYRLTIGGSRAITIAAADAPGAHAAVQTLRQLAGTAAVRTAALSDPPPALELPAVTVADSPSYSWRGVLLDVARRFVLPREVRRFIDIAAMHKLTTVVLHLTDDQGWRFESKRHPLLTQIGAWRPTSMRGPWRIGHQDGRPDGGFYTQDDLREIVAYARARGVTVVPEIDVPGHVQAAVAAYPELGVTSEHVEVMTTWGVSSQVLDPSEATLAFFCDIVDEIVEVFDSPWIGIGGDEVPTGPWRRSAAISARAAALGLSDVGQLHGWFVGRLAAHVIAKGRRPTVWDEALSEHLPRETVVVAWRGVRQGVAALKAGHDVVMAPEQLVYLDHRAGDGPDEPIPIGFLRTVADVLAFVPFPDGSVSPGELDGAPGRLLGGQAQLWAEHLEGPRRLDYAAYPRLSAFAEAVWSEHRDRSPGSPASAEFLERLEAAHLPRLAAAGVEYRPLAGPLPWQQVPGVAGQWRDLDAELAAAGWGGAGGWHEDEDGTPAGDHHDA